MLKNWWLAARPKTLMASVCPVTIGTALAIHDHAFHLPAALAALTGALSIQIGTNYCNDYFDFRQGADTSARKGPTRAVQAGLITPGKMAVATCLVFSVTAAICVYLVLRAGWPLAALGVISIFCGVWYTATRFSLAYLGLGDLFVLVFFGPIAVAGTYYVQSLRFSWPTLVAGIAPGLLSVAILVVNNLRDLQEDAAAQKRTLAVRLGARFARFEYFSCMIGAAMIPWIMWRAYEYPLAILIASAATLPGFMIATRLGNLSGTALNPMLGKTAAVLLLFTVTFASVCIVTA